MTNRHEIEALADAMEQYAIKRDSMGFVPNFSIEGKEKILQVAAALRSRTPSAPDVAMREALREKLQRAIIRPKSHDGPVRLCDQIDEVMKIVDAALSASEAKAGETDRDAHLGIVLSALRMLEEATGEKFDDDDGDVAAIEREWNARNLIVDPDDKAKAPTPPQVDREAVARIIDPVSWRVMDYELEQMKRKYRGKQIGWPADQFKDKASLKKADAILSLLAPTAPAQGERG